MAKINNASVQYNDLRGTSALDFHGGPNENLFGYATEMGIETDRYYPIGLSFYIGETGHFYLKFICTDNQIKEVFKEENDGKIPVIIFHKEEDLQSFLDRVKRFEVVFGSHDQAFAPHEIYKEYNSDGTESS